jgi:quercetin dioxygenase-like cupin family protein
MVTFVRRSAMRRFGLPVSIVAVVLLGIGALQAQPVAVAQEGTPTGGEMMPAGVTFQPVAFALGVDMPSSPSDLIVFRLGLEPGSTLPVDASPGVGILLVESGTLTVQVQGPVSVNRGAGMSAGMATAEATGDMSGLSETVAAGEVATLEAGDAVYVPGNVAGEIRNEGQAPATALVFSVDASQGMTGEATPAP